ncbi:hypothetical protein TRIUR3_02392 [Triticum urartu]|uniref:Peptidase A1 domain-containing protein n=1 Tax=Triticum urartu TaxID=4572 RepID=M7YZE5_TRIUA|nr:hypothetical protein TRIUR3_02392 [Triticum urartu]
MSSVYAFMLCFFLAVLNLVSLALGATGSSGAAGFSLPLVPHYRTAAGTLEELLPEGDAEGGMNITSIRPKMIPYSGAIYSVSVGIGSGETQHFYKLALDLVHPLTWMRCQPCIPEKKQDGSVFNTAVSPHYHFIASTDPRCTAPYKRAGQGRGRCTFDVKFQYEGSRANGLLSTDNFVFDGSGPGSPLSKVDGLPRRAKGHGPHAGAGPLQLHGGCTLDIGTADTLMTPDAYRVLVAEVVAHMHSRGVHRATVPGVQKLKLCFHGTQYNL